MSGALQGPGEQGPETVHATLLADESFICDGSPYGCEIALVGINRATQRVPWFPHWDAARQRFDKANWLAEYKRIRLARGYSAQSPTRERIQRIIRAAHPARVIEMNLSPVPTRRETDLPRGAFTTGVLERAIDAVRPRVALFYGRRPVRFAQPQCDAPLNLDEFVSWRRPEWGAVLALGGRHLSRWSYTAAEDVGRRLAAQAVGALRVVATRRSG